MIKHKYTINQQVYLAANNISVTIISRYRNSKYQAVYSVAFKQKSKAMLHFIEESELILNLQ